MGPRRSTGCRTCVRRRVKCDETHPFCQKCARIGVQCSGFPPPFRFVNETAETVERLEASLSQNESAPSTVLVKSSLASDSEMESESAFSFSSRSSASGSSVSSPELPLLMQPRWDVGSAGRQHIYLSFLLSSFFAIGANSDTGDHTGNRMWMTHCLADQPRYPTATLAMVALATGFYGRRHNQPAIVKEAAATYGRALLALAKDLQDPLKVWGYDALAATMALSLYEYVVFTDKKGWIQHAQGVARLIEMRGPQRFRVLPDRAILEMNRSILILQALASRKRSFLEREEWHGKSFYEEGETVTPIIRVFDVFSRLPGLTEDVMRLSGLSNPDVEELKKAQKKALGIVGDLEELRAELVGWEPEERPVSPASSLAIDSHGSIFTTQLQYSSLEAANTLTTLDAIAICGYEWLHKSHHLSWNRSPDHKNLSELPTNHLIQQYALRICQSVDYFLRPSHLQSGAFYLLFPARASYLAMPAESREAIWVKDVLQRLADASGFELARNVLGNIPLET